MRLQPDHLAAVYGMLQHFEPFAAWKLPGASDVRFRVIRTKTKYGDYSPEPHTMRVSAATVGHIENIMRIIAHECIHLYLYQRGRRNWDTHGAEFQRIAARVCKTHGWDLANFV